MADWIVADSLYRGEQFFCSHLDSYSHYIGECEDDSVARVCLNLPSRDWAPTALGHYEGKEADDWQDRGADYVFALDQYDRCAQWVAVKRIAQVAAICSPMPWEVRKPDGSPAYDLVISSIPWMVDAARAAGCRAEYQALAFDTRARVCGMGVERTRGCIFIGSTGPNHQRRAQLIAELSDVVEVLPPVYGREYFKTLASARAVVNIHAEWARGAANNMRMFEATGMGCALITDGTNAKELWPDDPESYEAIWDLETELRSGEGWKRGIGHIGSGGHSPQDGFGWAAQEHTLRAHTYESRIPQLIAWARSL